MKHILLLGATIGVLLVGCKKSDDGSAAQTNAPLPNPVESAQPLPPPPAPVAAAAENVPQRTVAGRVDPFLTQQLQIFVQQYGRMPESFAELAMKRLDSIPGPPPGAVWAIDTTTRQVKAVPVR